MMHFNSKAIPTYLTGVLIEDVVLIEEIRYICENNKRGKIRWAKHSRIPPNVVFHGKTFAVPYVCNNAIIRSFYNTNEDSQENFQGALENHKSLAQQIFPCLRYIYQLIVS